MPDIQQKGDEYLRVANEAFSACLPLQEDIRSQVQQVFHPPTPEQKKEMIPNCLRKNSKYSEADQIFTSALNDCKPTNSDQAQSLTQINHDINQRVQLNSQRIDRDFRKTLDQATIPKVALPNQFIPAQTLLSWPSTPRTIDPKTTPTSSRNRIKPSRQKSKATKAHPKQHPTAGLASKTATLPKPSSN